jgi:hypothetical protein
VAALAAEWAFEVGDGVRVGEDDAAALAPGEAAAA